VHIRTMLLAIATFLIAACSATAPRLSEAQRCTESGGIWRTATEFCEQTSGGSGY
jgi:hypothetical protein